MNGDIDKIASLKRKLSRHPFLRVLSSCPYRSPNWDRKVSALIEELGPKALVLDLGSASRRRAGHVINLEIVTMPDVDIVGDGHRLPFKDEIFNAVQK